MFLQPDEILTWGLKSTTCNLYVKISNNDDKKAPWCVDVFKEGNLIKTFDRYSSPEGARIRANEFVKDSHQIFNIDWVKEKLPEKKLLEKSFIWDFSWINPS